VAPGAALPALQRDFDEISRLVGEMLDDVQRRLARKNRDCRTTRTR